MRTTYWVSDEGAGLLNPGERPIHSLEKAQALALKAATKCSWECLTPPAPDNELHIGKGNFRCGVTSAHGIHIQETRNGLWGAEHDVPEEPFVKHKSAGPHVDWHLNLILDQGTGYGWLMAGLAIGPLLVAVLVIVAYPETKALELETINPEDASAAIGPATTA